MAPFGWEEQEEGDSMADPPRFPESPDDVHRPPDTGIASGPRRWFVVLWIVLVVALLGLMVFLHLTGAIGPGTH
jgi:hypothetical protein